MNCQVWWVVCALQPDDGIPLCISALLSSFIQQALLCSHWKHFFQFSLEPVVHLSCCFTHFNPPVMLIVVLIYFAFLTPEISPRRTQPWSRTHDSHCGSLCGGHAAEVVPLINFIFVAGVYTLGLHFWFTLNEFTLWAYCLIFFLHF